VVDVSRTQGGVRNSNLKVKNVFFVNNLWIVGFSSQSSVPGYLAVSSGMLSGSVVPHLVACRMRIWIKLLNLHRTLWKNVENFKLSESDKPYFVKLLIG
jgi:hypothetical protein